MSLFVPQKKKTPEKNDDQIICLLIRSIQENWNKSDKCQLYTWKYAYHPFVNSVYSCQTSIFRGQATFDEFFPILQIFVVVILLVPINSGF